MWLNQNNYIEHLSIDENTAKNVNILATSLNVLHNYFGSPSKIIARSDIRYLAKFLDISEEERSIPVLPVLNVINLFFELKCMHFHIICIVS